jgi:AmiR/NasT family two-component response regulator
MTVHRAAGMVMVQIDATIEEALLRLRATAYLEGKKINQVANDVVAGRRRFAEEKR